MKRIQFLWRVNGIWAIAILGLAWLSQDQRVPLTSLDQVSPSLLTLGAVLLGGQIALTLPLLLQRPIVRWAVAFTVVFESVILAGQLLTAPSWATPLYTGLALLPATLAARWHTSHTYVAGFAVWGLLATFDLATGGLAGGGLSTSSSSSPLSGVSGIGGRIDVPALLAWATMAIVLGTIVAQQQAKLTTTTESGPDVPEDLASQAVTLSKRLRAARNHGQVLEETLQAMGHIVEAPLPDRAAAIAFTFSKINLDEVVVSAVYHAEPSWHGRRMLLVGVLKEAMMGGEPAMAQVDAPLAEVFPALKDRWLLLLPLSTRLDVYGVMSFALRREPELDEGELKVLEAMASMASQALRELHLQSKLERGRRELLLDEEDTRHQLARDLHDGPIQTVAAVSMQIDYIKRLLESSPAKVAEELDDVHKATQHAVQELRTFMFGLRPVVLETEGLVPALEQYVRRLRIHDQLDVELEAGSVPRLDSIIEQNIFAIVREAVGNAKKYASGASIEIVIEREPSGIRTRVIDDGPGFDLEEVQHGYDRQASLGLINMRERAEMIGGFLKIRTSPGQGTTIDLFVPTDLRSP